jgi:alkaline phosphatase D
MPTAAVDVDWVVAEDPLFNSVVLRGTVSARPELGHSVHVEVSGLRPGREYYYRFRAGDEVSQTGRTKTAPAPGAPVDRLRFAVCGCQHYEHGYFTAFQHLADEAFDFVFHTGDYIYEYRDHGGAMDARVRHHNGREIYTVVDYRNRYALYKMDRHLKAAHASAPFVVTWDDHEVDNNYAGATGEDGTPPELFLLRRAAAYQAYYEHMPIRAAALPSGAQMRLYRRLRFGSLIDLSVLDTRQWRSDQACGDGWKSGCAEAADPRRTMLGDAQEQWLQHNLADASAQWTVLGQQVCSFAMDRSAVNPNAQFSMDTWDGYAPARDRLYRMLRDTRAPNPVLLSGDIHLHYGADLKLDFADPGSPTVGVEFTNSSITSNGDGADVSAGWEKTSGSNPHVHYHSARRGYIACAATPDTMRADFRIVDRVTIPDQPVRTGGSLVVEAGRPGCQTV